MRFHRTIRALGIATTVSLAPATVFAQAVKVDPAVAAYKPTSGVS